jgi:hypothetical protein
MQPKSGPNYNRSSGHFAGEGTEIRLVLLFTLHALERKLNRWRAGKN